MEMGDLPVDEAQTDIMQIARVGDIAAMEKIFESGEFDATFTDDEGITPLHVSSLAAAIRVPWPPPVGPRICAPFLMLPARE